MSNTVILGGTSYIGNCLYKRLSDNGKSVALINNPSSRLNSAFSNDIFFADILEPFRYVESIDSLVNTFSGNIDCIYVASWAGTKDLQNGELNRKSADGLYQYLKRIMEICRVGKIVQFGSQAEYGSVTDEEVTEETRCNPVTAYGREKLRFARMMTEYCLDNGVGFVEVRIHSIYGRGCVNVIGRVIENLLAGKTIVMKTDCKQWFDYLYIDDCIDALLAARSIDDGVYNIGSSDDMSMRDYINVAGSIINPKCEIVYGDSKDYGSINFKYNTDKFRKAAGWNNQYIFSEGIREIMRLLISDARSESVFSK
ncbi:MAG: NAD(P)-dependent oxidoreductase [Lachnospiraceae bacterium]|nr:NAD(P)-dependent oxidoreductase [Lachnospiraceae bacterium]